MNTPRLIRIIAMLFCISIASGCANTQDTQSTTASISGEVFYLPRVAVPPQAQVTVTLADVSRQDVEAVILAQTTFATEGRQVPFPFTLYYDHSDVQPGRTYAIRASITIGGQLWFTTTERISVRLDGTDTQPVQVRVDMARQ